MQAKPFAIYILLLAATITALPANADAKLTVMSFNIRYGTDGDGKNSWGKRRETVANAIRHHAPDVVGLQECIHFQAEYLVEALPEYQWIGMGREADGGHEMTAVLYRKETLSPIGSQNYWLSETPDVPGSISWDSAYVRMATQVKFMHRPSRKVFHFANTHLDSRGPQARLEGAKLMAQKLSPIDAATPTFVTGDFNALAEDSEPWNVFARAGFHDAWLTAKKQKGPVETFGGFRAPREDKTSRIDWILHRGSIRTKRCETSVYNDNGQFPSDHYPIVAQFILER